MKKRSKKDQVALFEVLTFTDEELLMSWQRIAKLIRVVELVEWTQAKQKAIALLEQGEALQYIEQVRSEFITEPVEQQQEDQEQTEKENPQVIPLRSVQLFDIPELNFQALFALAPGFSEQVEQKGSYWALAHKRGHRDVSLELIKKDQAGYYMTIRTYHDQVNDGVLSELFFFVDISAKKLESLSYSDAKGTVQVYKNAYVREMVKTREREEQNELLAQKLDELFGLDMTFEPAISPKEKRQRKKQKQQQRKEDFESFRKQVNATIPDFEPGSVELVAAHKKAGVTQKHIDLINEHQRGIILFPVRALRPATRSKEMDKKRSALLPGFRLSRTGKIYYEDRSNRSDLSEGL